MAVGSELKRLKRLAVYGSMESRMPLWRLMFVETPPRKVATYVASYGYRCSKLRRRVAGQGVVLLRVCDPFSQGDGGRVALGSSGFSNCEAVRLPPTPAGASSMAPTGIADLNLGMSVQAGARQMKWLMHSFKVLLLLL